MGPVDHQADPPVAAPSPATDRRSGRFEYLDALRAAAVSLVVVMHSGVTIAPGDGGVVVFFVISGFIITRLLLLERERTGGFDLYGFYRRRLYKLAPPLVAVVVLPTLVYAWFRPVDWGAFGAQIGFVYNWTNLPDYGASLDVLPGSEVVWSLAIEEQFYIGFALLWVLMLRAGRGRATLLVGALVVAAASLTTRFLLAVGQPSDPALWDQDRLQHVLRGTDTRLEAIALGVAVAAYCARGGGGGVGSARAQRRWSHPAVLVVAGLLFVAASLVFRGWWGEQAFRATFQALATVVTILHFQAGGSAGGAVARLVSWRPVQAVGLASYSIYLLHGPVLLALDPVMPAWPAGLLVVVRVLVSLVTGYLLYAVLETRVLELRKRRDARAAARRPAPAASPVS
jgi:peptidoglycan/LPS O-acetylase OafA/YrhL